ncbi:hypothetical protein [Curtobacterium sp. TXMA1]|uniref:hypothetical protein n=1 Tax=Curtobacterium sp. TXMA1 TaxID=2876939 RepID=UPI001CCC1B81|nr:hypothetical protein [Curtobacterium sp. TXMA1]UBQ02548.1 hypothetical protein LCG91_16115 [Curtobacterium sp. TXMA1]
MRILALARSNDPQQRRRLFDLAHRVQEVQELSNDTIASLTDLEANTIGRLAPRHLENGDYEHPDDACGENHEPPPLAREDIVTGQTLTRQLGR